MDQTFSYSATIRLTYANDRGMLGRIATAIGEQEGMIGAIDIVSSSGRGITRDVSVNAANAEHVQRIAEHLEAIPGLELQTVSDQVFLKHLGGKIEVVAKTPIKSRDDLSSVYTPGVARVCMAIHEDVESSYSLTIRKNMVAVVSDGSAVLGLGNIGPEAAMPVMEGKAMLFKEFGGVDAFPICIATQDVEEIIATVQRLEPTFGGINLEDISSPRCIEIERRLNETMDIPVFHDDQHGTAIVTLAGLENALRLVQKKLNEVKIVINGAGAAGAAIAKLLQLAGAEHVIVCDREGAIFAGRTTRMNPVKDELAAVTNKDGRRGSLRDVVQGADVFVGVSSPDVLTVDDVKSMASDPIVFAMANPDPEIRPELANGHVAVMATGRSDHPNQINNVLCFPGLFRGVLDVRASEVNDAMKVAAAKAIADIITDDERCSDYIIPSVFDRRVAAAVAKAVADAAAETGVARRRPKKAGSGL
ncbi:NAD-dependent malic enzyme [Rosistilla ulvae]|uniref:NAD-dependent malic enzyme n=1 Tax=Rosistilla ulvae TaxID=1930277 RepID=A0A517LV47_9BACT|nr:NAD-dependent malic enzyme [Rosistilla ulvae]QDS86498.1 NAD-dependent malic enzyme [Rosistilla ulvae]